MIKWLLSNGSVILEFPKWLWTLLCVFLFLEAYNGIHVVLDDIIEWMSK